VVGPPIKLLGLPKLTADHWERIRPLLPKPRSGHEASESRPLLDAMLWVMQTGSTWRELPERFGPWLTVAERFYRWRKEGRWDRILQVLQEPSFASSA
jgi:transposase